MIVNQKMQRLFFTIGIIVIYRFATFITIPGIDLSVVDKFYSENSGILGIFNSLSGGAVSRMSIMALNLIPYVSASIVMQLLTAVIPEWRELKKDSYQRRKITRYSRILALGVSFVQSLGMAVGLENVPGLVISPGIVFKFTTVLSVMSASLLLMWLAERIGERGIGNGSSIIIFTSILANSLPMAISTLSKTLSDPNMKYLAKWILITLAFFILMIIVCEAIRFNIKVFFKQPSLIYKSAPELGSNFVPIKINPAGILPSMFADSMMVIPAIIMRLLETKFKLNLGWFAQYLSLILRSALILFFCVFCLSFVMNSEDVSDNLRSRNAYIDGVPEGTATTNYFQDLLNKITVFGCIYTLFVTILPDLLALKYFGNRSLISGTSLLIVIGVALEVHQRLAPEPIVAKDSDL